MLEKSKYKIPAEMCNKKLKILQLKREFIINIVLKR